MTAHLPAPITPPLSEERGVLLARLVDGLEAPALHWLSGYAAGLAAQPGRATRPLQAVPVAETGSDARLTLVYGSQTGNARREAEKLAAEAEASGLSVRLLRADAYPLRELASERLLYVVISTQGDGDPPDDALAFVEFLASRRAPALKELRYAVLGLGDASYPQFNAIGRRLDARLAELGATRVFALGEADVDIDTVAAPWRQQALTQARDLLKSPTVATVTALRPTVPTAVAWSRERPFAAGLLSNQRITARESDQDVRHLELALADPGLSYEPGDALGVWPRNDDGLVDEVLATLALDGEEAIRHGDETLPLRDWLGTRRELTRLSRPFLARHAALSNDVALNRLLAPEHGAALAQRLSTEQLADLLAAHPAPWSGEELVAALRPLAPRLYSIASSRKAVGDEAHLTLARVDYAHGQARRHGVASHFLSHRDAGATVPVFIERNERFRLPSDLSRDILMIGPGTGVAPFRGFVQERIATGASGRNWLVFGARHARSQFLYQLEWQDALKNRQLHRLDLAFSRDQAERIYVQQRLRENGRAVYDWLVSGAQVYVCGAVAMGKDVHAALLEIVAEHGARSPEDAGEFLAQLLKDGRYARDVY
ncbi:assimilatory sulfite reductase (NADPH) flavoprotein subunit [Arenimonas oryziterrae]|uniref:assimilatory sulfite reductase (NADPH) n=1 Tax=Arenimonas oryziterrae DSM 21050 = YC6267 TaxID=1121015 RepID=A0A091AZN0_9GAMM|nr:assimilatory sulfite reductase (NADPH) flavoprotein subunit [Arenimonas oryziterrae]KFN44089.1 hypothetical protein N789_06645 [Arenimonas oryziterrae DSM 21050 = YC6267]